MAIDTKKAIKQADFCLELMQRLNVEIEADKTDNKKEKKTMKNKSGKWLFDGDCLICNHCGKAVDYHPKHTSDGNFIVPDHCPKCGDEKKEMRNA